MYIELNSFNFAYLTFFKLLKVKGKNSILIQSPIANKNINKCINNNIYAYLYERGFLLFYTFKFQCKNKITLVP